MITDHVLIRVTRDYWISEWIKHNQENYIHIHKDEVLIADKFYVDLREVGKSGDVYEVRSVWLPNEIVEELK